MSTSSIIPKWRGITNPFETILVHQHPLKLYTNINAGSLPSRLNIVTTTSYTIHIKDTQYLGECYCWFANNVDESTNSNLPRQECLGVVQIGPSLPGIHWVRIGSGEENPGEHTYSLIVSSTTGPLTITPLPNSSGGGGQAGTQTSSYVMLRYKVTEETNWMKV